MSTSDSGRRTSHDGGARRQRTATIRRIALAVGIVLFAVTLAVIDLDEAASAIRRLGVALPIAIGFSAVWHLVRTWAWAWCFPEPRPVRFMRLARVRLAAEAFSYLTIRGIAGEPLKVVLLAGEVDAREATAAVALERIAYMIGTTLIVGVGAAVAIWTLPLTHGWFRVFRAFAIAGGVIAALTATVIAGKGSYLRAVLQRVDRSFASHLTEGRVGRFLSTVERLMLELVRHSPKRLAVLAVATIVAFVCMVLEAWIVMRAAGASISLVGAFAVETFSRVVSFGSAVIPANLGALEASSVAAAASIGAGGGAALAIARRIRGLFWAGLGLLIYPRQPMPSGGRRAASAQSRQRTNTLLYLPNAPDVEVQPWVRLAGLPIAERVVRSAARAGYSDILVFSPRAVSTHDQKPQGRLASVLREVGGHIVVAHSDSEWRRAIEDAAPAESFTVVGPGSVVSPALLRSALALTPAGGEIADVAAGQHWPESGVLRVGRSAAADIEQLHAELSMRRARPVRLPSGEDVSAARAQLALRILDETDLEAAETTIRRSIYKDTDSKIARFNRRMSLPISIPLIATPLTANQLSTVLIAIGFYSAWLFSLGHYWTGVLAAFLSLAASVLDGCDGEIARLKYQESALGCWIETIGDYSYYLAIFAGLTIGAVRQTGWTGFHWLGALAFAGTLLSFAILIHLRRRITAGRPERLHSIARARFKANPTGLSRLLWKVSFVATRAAMPYGIMALALVNALPLVIVLATIGANIYWISLLLKMRDLLEQEAPAPSVTAN
jgi:phosphatidylglycerophosphate synthase